MPINWRMTGDDTDTLRKLSALGHPTRLSAFKLLMRAGSIGLSAGAISGTLAIAPSLASNHLQILLDAGLIEGQRRGRNMVYTANVAAVSALIGALVHDCCDGHPQLCAELSALPGARCP